MEDNEEQNDNNNNENNNNNDDNQNGQNGQISNLTNISFNQSTISYYNASKDNYHSKCYKKALINIHIYIQLVPNNPKAYVLKGKIYLNLKEFQKSLNCFLRCIKLGEKTLEILYGIARCYKELYQFDDALKYYNKALELDPSAKSYYLFAKCLYSMGKKEYAIEIYNKAIELNPNYIEAYFNKGICLSNLNFKEEAINMYNKTIELNPNFVDAYFQRGYCYYNLKKYQKAMVEMNKVLELDPNYYQAYYEKGFCFQKMKRYEEAIIEISKSIKQNTNFEKAYFQRGYCLELINDYTSAINDYKKVIELNKNSYMGYYRLGLCFLYKKNFYEALNMFDESIQLNRANYDAYYYKGMCQRYLKYYEDAIISFNFFLNCFVKNKSLSLKEISEEQIANVYYNKGRCLLSLERYAEAIQMFTNYLKKNKNSYEVYFQRAICYYNVQKYKKAVFDLSFVIQELSEKKKENDKIEEKNKILDETYEFEENEEEEKISRKNIEDETEEILPEIYFLRCKSNINLDKIENGLKDINNFFDLIELEKQKLKEEFSKIKSKKQINNIMNLNMNINLNNIDINNITENDINKIIYQKYDITEAHFKKGYCHLVLLDYNSAMKEFEEVIKLDKSYAIAYFNMGICLYNLNRKKEAIYYYQKVLNLYPLDIEAFINLLRCYRETGNPKKSYDLLVQKMPLFINDEKNFVSKLQKVFFEMGMCLFQMENYDESLIYLTKSIYYELHRNKITTNNNNNNTKDIKIDKLFLSECYYRKGFSLSKLNNKKEAINNFDEAIKYNDKNPDIYNYKAHCLTVLEKYEEAIETYIKIINLDNKDFLKLNDCNYSIGYCYLKLKKFEDALKYFNISRNINEDKIKNMYLKGIDDCNEGRGEESLMHFYSKYKILSSKFNELNYYTGICFIELKQYENAIINFDKCIKYDKKFAEAYFNKGIVYSLLNKSKEAIEQFEIAIKYNSNIEEYKEALNKEKEKIKNNINNNGNIELKELLSINNSDKNEEKKDNNNNSIEERKEYSSNEKSNNNKILISTPISND